MKVFTNIKTLKRVKRLLNELDLGGLLDGGKLEISAAELINKLLDEDKLVEFLQTITRDEKTDFEEMEASEIGGLLDSFLSDIMGYLPSSLRNQMQILQPAKTSS